MTTFNWTISTLEYDLTENNSVITAHWRCTATDDAGEFSAGSYGTCGFSADPAATDFVPYADLTEEVVLGWCFEEVAVENATDEGDPTMESMSASVKAGIDKDGVEASLQANIDLQMTPVKASGVPW